MNKKFFIRLSIYAGALVVLAAITLAVIWSFLGAYELSRPERAMDQFFATTDEEYWITQFTSHLNPNLSQFESKENYFSILYEKFFKDAIFSYTPSSQYTDDEPKYTVRSNGTTIATVALKQNPNEKVGFGLKAWYVDTIYAVDFMAGNEETVVITVPATSKVTLNGIELDKSYITDSNVAYNNLSQFEMTDGYQAPHRVTYTIPGLYMQPEVVVEDAQLVISNGLVFDYCHEDMGSYDVSITIPAGSTILIGGITIGTDLLEGGTIYPGFKELGNILSNLPVSQTLNMEGFVLPPVIEVKDFNGNTLTPDENGVYALTESKTLKDACEDIVKTFANDYISFTTNLTNEPYSAYNKLAKNLYTGSNFQNRLKQSVADMEWVYNVKNTIHDISAFDFVEYADGVGSCSLHISVTSKTNYESREIDNTYTLALIKVNGVWKIASMEKQ